MENLDFLIQYLEKERIEKNKSCIKGITNKKDLYRALCNVREAEPIDEIFLQKEKEYLQEELKKKQLTDATKLPNISQAFPGIEKNISHPEKIYLWKGDITTIAIEGIVNAGNSRGLGCFQPLHLCIDNQIHTNAGVSLRLDCNEIMKDKKYNLKTGEVFVTKGYNLPAKYVFHTVGPIILGKVTKEKEDALASCYRNTLELAREKGIRSIAFPCLSTGVFNFPKKQASQIAIQTVVNVLEKSSNSFERIVFCVWDEEDYKIYQENLQGV